MMTDTQPLTVVIDGVEISLGLAGQEPLVRAVIISLFTWRRANPDDELPAGQRMGWWGDTFPPVINDRIGSRLWLLRRAKLTQKTVLRAHDYAREALEWLVDDGVAARVEVEAERIGMDALGLACRFYQGNGSLIANLRFSDIWAFINK